MRDLEIGLAFKAIENLPDADVGGNEPRPLPRHEAQHSFPVFVDESHLIEIDHASLASRFGVSDLPNRLQFLAPWLYEATT
jgi:hypothetical protein